MDIQKIYHPGAEVVIFSDDRVFSGKMEKSESIAVFQLKK